MSFFLVVFYVAVFWRRTAAFLQYPPMFLCLFQCSSQVFHVASLWQPGTLRGHCSQWKIKFLVLKASRAESNWVEAVPHGGKMQHVCGPQGCISLTGPPVCTNKTLQMIQSGALDLIFDLPKRTIVQICLHQVHCFNTEPDTGWSAQQQLSTWTLSSRSTIPLAYNLL